MVKKPRAVNFEEAAASVMCGLTALIAMRDVGKVSPGSRVLINGASGGVGTMAVQIAASMGADVTGVCSTRNVELVCSLGAARVIDYAREDFIQDAQRENLNALAGLLESGTLRVIVDETYQFDQTAAAVAHMLGHHARGKVAISVP